MAAILVLKRKKALTAEAVRTHCFYSDKHINVNVTPIMEFTLLGLSFEVHLRIVQIQRKIANLSIFPNYFFSLIAACTVDRVAITTQFTKCCISLQI